MGCENGTSRQIARDGLAVHQGQDWWTCRPMTSTCSGAKILKGATFFATLFSYIVWPSAMKFGTVTPLGVRPIDTCSQIWWTLGLLCPPYREDGQFFQFVVTLFSYVVWPSAMKFGTIAGLKRFWWTLVQFYSPCGNLNFVKADISHDFCRSLTKSPLGSGHSTLILQIWWTSVVGYKGGFWTIFFKLFY